MRILKQFGVKVRVLGVERASKPNSDAVAALSAEIDAPQSKKLSHAKSILPQAMRAIMPGMANDTISMIKGTSIASVIFVRRVKFVSRVRSRTG